MALFFIALPIFLGLMIAVSVSGVFEVQPFANSFRFPVIFLCGLFITVEGLPLFLRPLSYCLPLTYGADVLKSSINGNGHIGVWTSLLILLGFSIALFSVSTRKVQKKWIQ